MLKSSSVCIYSTQKDMCDVMLAFLCSWLPVHSSATNVAGALSSKACPLSSSLIFVWDFCLFAYSNLYLLCTVQKPGFILGITFVYVSDTQMIWPNERCYISTTNPTCLLLVTFTTLSSEFVLNRFLNLCSKCYPCINHPFS